MKNRTELEDFCHNIICKILPDFDTSKVRPVYQDNADQGMNFQSNTDDIAPFSNYSDFIYFLVDTDYATDEAYTYEDGNVDVVRGINLKVYVYGENSSKNVLKLFSFIRSDALIQYLEENGYYLYTMSDKPSQVYEIINDEWWERHDVDYTLCRLEDLESNDFKVETAEKFSIGVEDV